MIGAVLALVAAGIAVTVVLMRSDSESPAATPTTDRGASTETTLSVPDVSLDLVSAGPLYLEIVNPVNCAGHALANFEQVHLDPAASTDPTLFDQHKALVGALAAARQAAYRSLLAETWPAEVADEIEILAREWSSQAQAEQAISTALNVESFNLMVQTLAANPVLVDANPGVIRAILGLAPADQTDRC